MSTVVVASQDVAVEEKHWQRDENLPHAQPQADDELLRRFVAERDETAFTQIVTRHSPLVMSVCRRLLGNEQDAEDAFQATFLVLARKAASVRRGASLPAWLYKTAYRIALRARSKRSRRSEQPLEAENMIATDTFAHISGEHQQSVLDEELNRLPEKYRLPLFLCCVEGKSRDEAAEQLGLSPGALKGRLERGRKTLRRKLMLRGVSLALVLSVVLRSQQTVQAAHAVASSLITSTAHAGVQYAAGKSALGLVSKNALSLANGSIQIMSMTTTKLIACCLFVIGVLAVASNWLPAPARAGGDVGETIVLTAASDVSDDSGYVVAFLSDDEREGQRRSAEEEGRRRSPEAEAGPRRSPEAEAGPRRSPEAETGPRRSPEAEAGPRRSAEGDRRRRRSAEGEARREGNSPLQGFRPQTRREAALYQMILQLQREVAELRRAVQPRDGAEREGSASSEGAARRDQPQLPPRWQFSKEGKVFKTYDKNGDSVVTLDEWLAMTNGNISPARRELQTKRFREAEPSGDGKFTPAEFIYWYSKGRFENRDEGQRGSRDGEPGRSAGGDAGASRSSEGEGQRRSSESEAGPRRSSEGE